MKIALGDLFTLPLGPDKVAVGQVVEVNPSSRALWVAIFWPPVDVGEVNERAEALSSTAPVLLAQTFDIALKSGRWPRLTNAPVTPIPWPAFKIASAPGVFQVVDHTGTRRRLASQEEIAVLRFRSTVSEAGVEQAAKALAGIAEWRDAFNKMRVSPHTEAVVLGDT